MSGQLTLDLILITLIFGLISYSIASYREINKLKKCNKLNQENINSKIEYLEMVMKNPPKYSINQKTKHGIYMGAKYEVNKSIFMALYPKTWKIIYTFKKGDNETITITETCSK